MKNKLPELQENIRLQNGQPLLHFIVENCNSDKTFSILQIALNHNFNTNILNENHETALHLNFMRSNHGLCCKITDILLRYQSNPFLVTRDQKMTALHLLVLRNKHFPQRSNCKCFEYMCENNQGLVDSKDQRIRNLDQE